MNWFTENKVFSGFLVVLALAAAALAYLLFSARSNYVTAQQTYESGVQTLVGLRALSPFRNAENLKKYQEQVTNYKDTTNRLHEELLQRQGEIPNMEPAAFQDRLRDLVSKAVAHASERGVELPEKFYLGFEQYENELPRNEITGLLNWQLTAVDFVINRLIDFKVTKINNIFRSPLPGEAGAEVPAKEIPLVKKYPFEVVFFGYPGNTQSILNELAGSKQAMIARAVRIENEALRAPSRLGDPAAPAGPDGTPAPTPRDTIIIGKEKVTCSIIIDLVQFTKPAPKK